MNGRHRNGDGRQDGAAAVELGILLGLMLLVATVVFPLGQAFYEKVRLGRAAGDAIRFATSTPNSAAYGSSGRRPSAADIRAEAVRAYAAAGGSGLTAGDVRVVTAAEPGGTATVRITKNVDLGPLGSFITALHVTHSSSITISVDASGREE